MAHESGTRKNVDVAEQVMFGVNKGDIKPHNPADFVYRGECVLVVWILQVSQPPLSVQYMTFKFPCVNVVGNEVHVSVARVSAFML